MQGALDWAATRGVRAVYLEVVENEDPSWSLYGRLGFVRREVDPFGAHVDGQFVQLGIVELALGLGDPVDQARIAVVVPLQHPAHRGGIEPLPMRIR